jgi:small subunit ribosomal protein S9
MERVITSGKRKTSVARAVTKKGTGIITINKEPYTNFQLFDRLKIEEPIKIAEKVLGKFNFDVKINVRGGGSKSQIDAARVALARAIVKFTDNKDIEKIFLEYDRNLLVADVRRKEAYKPGDSKARRKRQSSFR